MPEDNQPIHTSFIGSHFLGSTQTHESLESVEGDKFSSTEVVERKTIRMSSCIRRRSPFPHRIDLFESRSVCSFSKNAHVDSLVPNFLTTTTIQALSRSMALRKTVSREL